MSVWQIAEAQMTHTRPDQPIYLIADLIKHAADLAIDPLPQYDPETSGRDRLHPADLGALAVEHDSAC